MKPPKWEIEWGKMFLCFFLLICGFTIIMISLLDNHIDEVRFTIGMTTGVSLMTGVMGYIFGNGKLASRGEYPVPAIGIQRETDHIHAAMEILLEKSLENIMKDILKDGTNSKDV